MSAVVDSISEAVLPPPSTPPGGKKDQGKADVSSGPGGKPDTVSPTATLVDTSSSSILTRVDTPHPERSTQGDTRRVSISAASPIVANFTPERRPRQLYQYEEQEPHNLSDSEHSDDGNEPLLNPYRPVNPDNTFDSTATSGSDVNMTTISSSAPEVSFGPQEVPFPLRQRETHVDAHSTPSRPPTQTYQPRFRTTNAPPVVIRPITTEKIQPTSRSVTTATAVVSSGDDYDSKLLSTWRREQIKTTRTAKLMAGTTPRPIPTLHGPLSLPYARNPSGVDATVADESAYLSHVFGLRAAGGMTLNDAGVKTAARRVSSGTRSSGTTTSRSASGSSGLGNTTKSSQDRSVLTEGSSYTTAGGTHHARPIVIRDPYQNIGIKIKGVPSKEGPAVPLIRDSRTSTTEDKENLDPSSSKLRRRASETSLLEPRIGDAVIGPSRSQVNLRDLTNLSPIPGSPAESAARDPFRVLYNRALTSGVHDSNTEGLLPVHPEATHSGAIKLPTLVPIYFNPTSMTYEVAVPQRSSYEDLHINTPLGVVTPQTLKTSHASTVQPSKADSSDNWRKKGENADTDQASRTGLVVPANTPTATQENNADDKGSTAEGDVMTIDSLFEKFHTTDEQPEGSTDPTASVACQASNKRESAKQPGLKSSKSNPASPKGTSVNVLGESTKKLNADAPPYSPSKTEKHTSSTKKRPSSPITTKGMPTPSKANSSSARGTPGAGKLLKKFGGGEEENTGSPSTSVTSKGKGKAKAGKK
ncbi:hypothetical protein L486_00938 [Kwoniella mangroviensis CBS 10435]|uniref:Uncharacterized protein n=1 Tax=Kwoniella mangroviensis CBS 10435 TaxID=1331196 RepID=A0A1B9J0H1_9TREE|nr:hypothetical protein L486_00938 [Kwoniella mangroviensis CBS 10435]